MSKAFSVKKHYGKFFNYKRQNENVPKNINRSGLDSFEDFFSLGVDGGMKLIPRFSNVSFRLDFLTGGDLVRKL